MPSFPALGARVRGGPSRPLLLLLVALVTPGEVLGQDGPRFWGGIGVGTGSARVACDICNDDRRAAISGLATVGFSLGRRVLAGIEADAWWDEGGTRDDLLWAGTGVVKLFPDPDGGFWTKAGAGVVHYRSRGATNTANSRAPGVLIGAGYDLRMASRLFVGPYATLVTSFRSDLEQGDRVILEKVSHSLLHLGVVFQRR